MKAYDGIYNRYVKRILDIADRIILIANGQVKAEGSKEEIMPLILGEGGSGPCNILKDKM